MIGLGGGNTVDALVRTPISSIDVVELEEGVVRGAELLHRVLPDLEMFNVTIQAVHQLPIGAAEIWMPVAYALFYTSVLMALGSIIFERRDFR